MKKLLMITMKETNGFPLSGVVTKALGSTNEAISDEQGA